MFWILLKNEFIKASRLYTYWIVIISIIIPALITFLFIYPMTYDEFLHRVNTTSNDPNPYNYLFKWFSQSFNLLFIPFCALIIILIQEIERAANGWKTLLMLPVNPSKLVYSKLLTVLISVAKGLFLCTVVFYCLIVILRLLKPDWLFVNYVEPSFSFSFGLFAYVFIVSVPAIILLFILALSIKNNGVLIILATFASFLPIPQNPFRAHQQLKYIWMNRGYEFETVILLKPLLLFVSMFIIVYLIRGKILSRLF